MIEANRNNYSPNIIGITANLEPNFVIPQPWHFALLNHPLQIPDPIVQENEQAENIIQFPFGNLDDYEFQEELYESGDLKFDMSIPEIFEKWMHDIWGAVKDNSYCSLLITEVYF